jgi:YNFM family putative membrane transporter
MTVVAKVRPPRIVAGTACFRRMAFAMFLGGFATFSLLYCVQPLLPTFSRVFDVSPAQSSLALSLATGMLAVAIALAGAVSQRIEPKKLMFASMALAALANVCAAVAPNRPVLLAVRTIEGFLLGGVSAVAMAQISEEMDPRDLGAAMGLYVAGTAFGGMAGRVGIGLLVEIGSWRSAMVIVGLLDLVAAIGFLLLLPRPRYFEPPRKAALRTEAVAWREALSESGQFSLFVIAFCLMGVFVTIFNYAEFRLEDQTYGLSEAQSSLVFLVCGVGIAGILAALLGRRPVLAAGLAVMLAGVALTLFAGLALIMTGIALVTMGFFVAHAVASGWVGALAGGAKGQTSALYLLFYYGGSSVLGSVGGWFRYLGGWRAVGGFTALIGLAGLALALRMKANSAGKPA